MPHGFDAAAWAAAKRQAKDLIASRAKLRGMITYSDLVARLDDVRMEAHDSRLSFFLDEISREEDAEGRGMMTVLVVHKLGDMQPGPGFFDLASELGRDTRNVEACWVAEMRKVHAVWSLRHS